MQKQHKFIKSHFEYIFNQNPIFKNYTRVPRIIFATIFPLEQELFAAIVKTFR